MKILVDSVAGDGLSLGLALMREGHTVWMSIQETASQQVGQGLIAKADDAVAAAKKADLVIVDMVGRGSTADLLSDYGVPVIGASEFADKIEFDRLHFFDVARAAGLLLPPTEMFPDADLDRAIHFVEQAGGKWVYKPSGNLGADKTFLADDAEEMVEYLERLTETQSREEGKIAPFCLQAFVEGVEVSTERWYAEGEAVRGLDNCTIEHKKFLAGDLGPAVGCAGNVVFPADAELLRQTVNHLDNLAAAHGHSGPIDLNAIVAGGKAYILEATPRFGYDALFAYLRLWRMPIGETLQAIAEGEVPPVQFAPGVAAAVRVSVPPYPAGDPEKARGFPIVDEILDSDDYWPLDVMLDDHERLVISGSDATAYVVTARGATIRDAYEGCYRRLRKSRLPDRQYRPDLVECSTHRMGGLRRMGFFSGGLRAAAG